MAHSLKSKMKTMAVVAAGGAIAFLGVGALKGDDDLYRNCFVPLVHCLDAETAHRLGVWSTRLLGQLPRHLDKKSSAAVDPDILRTKVWNCEFSNPVGMAAGFDKNGEAVSGLFKLGFGFVEIGSVTPRPQPGNAKPRVFRLTEDKAVINSDGHEAVHERLNLLALKRAHHRGEARGILAVNLGKNASSEEASDSDYEEGVRRFADVADFFVINVSSPNTTGLRNLQTKDALSRLLDAVLRARKSAASTIPVLVKIAPDLTSDERRDIANVILSKGIDGIVVSNTTVSRPATLMSPLAVEKGGLSGEPLKERSTEAIREIYALTKGKLPIIGVGGISSGKDAYEKIRAGASLIELYTVIVYEGPPVVARIKRELEELLRNDGFRSVAEAVGVHHRRP